MPRKKNNPAQIPLLELALKTAPSVPAIRQAVRDWVAAGYKGATATSKTLLKYWFHTDHRTFNGDKFQYPNSKRPSCPKSGATPPPKILPMRVTTSSPWKR